MMTSQTTTTVVNRDMLTSITKRSMIRDTGYNLLTKPKILARASKQRIIRANFASAHAVFSWVE